MAKAIKEGSRSASLFCFLSICQSVKGVLLLHRHLLVIAKVDALRQTGDVCTNVLAVEGVDLIGCWVIGVG